MITVIGASGQLGTAFRHLVDDGVFLSRETVDLSDPERAVSALRPLVRGPVVNCAAWTAVDAAEAHEAEATVVNGAAVGALAALCHEVGVPFVTFSTDYVFGGDGTEPYAEDSTVDPVNAYGRSKAAGEAAALRHPGSLVVRTSWVQSWTHPCFIRTMVEQASRGTRLSVVSDQVGRPTFAEDLARGALEAIGVGATGLLHLANDGEGTWFDLATEAIALAGGAPPEPCGTDDWPTPAARPAYSVLGLSRAERLGIRLSHWRDSLVRVVALMLADGGFGASRRTIPTA